MGLHAIANTDVVLVQYADDFGIIVKARNIELLEETVQKAVDEFSTRAEQLNFTINPEKTKTILFTNNDKSVLHVNIDGFPVETVRNARYLGVTPDRYLSFRVHIRETRAKINDRLKNAQDYIRYQMWKPPSGYDEHLQSTYKEFNGIRMFRGLERKKN